MTSACTEAAVDESGPQEEATADAPTDKGPDERTPESTAADSTDAPIDEVEGRASQPNILLLIADDLGVDFSPCYADGAPPAPNLAAACERGVVFDQAWSSPVCSPTRAGMLTGRHGFRTGIGEAATPDNGLIIGADEVTLPRALDRGDTGYAHANFGKWHLGGDADNPNRMGWSHFSGTLSGGLRDYESWTRVTNGVEESMSAYATSATVDAAQEWIAEQDEPWLTWVGFNAPHTPFHLPPSDLHSHDLSGSSEDIDADPEPYYRAAIEALDTEIGRLLDSVDLEETVVIFVGDNGTPSQVSDYERNRAKGSLAQGGVHVPMVIWGAGVDGGVRSDALVGTIDVFATALELAGLDPDALDLPTIDSTSLVPVLQGRPPSDGRHLLAEAFGPATAENRAGVTIRNERYKLIRFDDGRTRFADLSIDPTGGATIPAARRTADDDAAFEELSATLDAWLADTGDSPSG